MMSKTVLALTLLSCIATGPVFAQPIQQSTSVTAETGVRKPIYGDPGVRRFNPHWTARQWARADRQGPGTENGNQPDRAEAGGG